MPFVIYGVWFVWSVFIINSASDKAYHEKAEQLMKQDFKEKVHQLHIKDIKEN